MKHKGTVRLETPRLILRRYVIDDFEPMYRNCWSEYDVWKWTNYVPMDCLDDVKTKANMFTENWLSYDNPRRYSWAIELKSTGDVIGRMFGMHPDDELGQVELAYEMADDRSGARDAGFSSAGCRSAAGVCLSCGRESGIGKSHAEMRNGVSADGTAGMPM